LWPSCGGNRLSKRESQQLEWCRSAPSVAARPEHGPLRGRTSPRRSNRVITYLLMKSTEMNKINSMRNSCWLFNTRLSILAGHADTEGRFDLVEGCFPPGTQSPPHRHGAYAEQLYVLDGEFTVWAGGSNAVLRPGDNLVIPAGTAHVVAATGSGPGRGLVIASPSGFARLITEVGTPDGGDAVPPPHPSTGSVSSASPPIWATRSSARPAPCPTDEDGPARAGDRATRTSRGLGVVRRRRGGSPPRRPACPLYRYVAFPLAEVGNRPGTAAGRHITRATT